MTEATYSISKFQFGCISYRCFDGIQFTEVSENEFQKHVRSFCRYVFNQCMSIIIITSLGLPLYCEVVKSIFSKKVVLHFDKTFFRNYMIIISSKTALTKSCVLERF